jgi:uncharacterized repeat protein (TIGR03803 family)
MQLHPRGFMVFAPRPTSNVLVALGLMLCGLLAAGHASARGFGVLYNFAGGTDGSTPRGILGESKDTIYGTTVTGGTAACGCGTLFELTPDGRHTVLHSFAGGPGDGAAPYGGVTTDAKGNLYATTSQGGTGTCTNGCGTVVKIDRGGNESVLHSFQGGAQDGAVPRGSLLLGADGDLYGTTTQGGPATFGTVFKITPRGRETVRHAFAGAWDGMLPLGTLISDADGNLFGTTGYGGSCFMSRYGCGILFRLSPNGTNTTLLAFGESNVGDYPNSGLVSDGNGNLYGTTLAGTAADGSVFKLAADGTTTVLHAFQDGSDGGSPNGLVFGRDGYLYGTTVYGGGDCNCGTLYSLTPDGTKTVLHAFDGAQGAAPQDGLTVDRKGVLYGTTGSGGAGGAGTLFKFKPEGQKAEQKSRS